MEFEWDEAKSALTRRERGFGFGFAIRIFAGPVIEVIDARRDYGEKRMQAIGRIGDAFVVVIYTDRGQRRRIISAWLANRRMRGLWLKQFG